MMGYEPLDQERLFVYGVDLEQRVRTNHPLRRNARAGERSFRRFFEQVVSQCVEAALVDGSKPFIDTSLIDADASTNPVVNTQSLTQDLKKGYEELEQRLDDEEPDEKPRSDVNKRHISTLRQAWSPVISQKPTRISSTGAGQIQEALDF